MTQPITYVNVYDQEAAIIQEARRIDQMIDTMDASVYGSTVKMPYANIMRNSTRLSAGHWKLSGSIRGNTAIKAGSS